MNAAKVILICGKICSGKSTYAEKLRLERRAAVLSCDDLTLALFPEQLGDQHEEITRRAHEYLFQRAAELLALSVNVILEWGFWTVESRREAEAYFRNQGFETEWHYVEISDDAWRECIKKRNGQHPSGAYAVDRNLMEKCASLFQPPDPKEIDVWHRTLPTFSSPAD